MNNTKRLIFQSAIIIFSECGYNGATMEDIAFKAGVAKGTLYYHFKSKEDIFKFIITEGMNLITEEVRNAVLVGQNPIEKFKALCKVELNLVYENRNFFKVVMSQLWGQESRQQELRNIVHSFIKTLERFIQNSMDDGFIQKGQPDFMSYSIFGTLCSAAVYELINQSKTEVDDVVENLMGYILKGIGA